MTYAPRGDLLTAATPRTPVSLLRLLNQPPRLASSHLGYFMPSPHTGLALRAHSARTQAHAAPSYPRRVLAGAPQIRHKRRRYQRQAWGSVAAAWRHRRTLPGEGLYAHTQEIHATRTRLRSCCCMRTHCANILSRQGVTSLGETGHEKAVYPLQGAKTAPSARALLSTATDQTTTRRGRHAWRGRQAPACGVAATAAGIAWQPGACLLQQATILFGLKKKAAKERRRKGEGGIHAYSYPQQISIVPPLSYHALPPPPYRALRATCAWHHSSHPSL